MVSIGSASQPATDGGAASGPTNRWASSAGGASRAAWSAAATRDSSESSVTPPRDTTPTDVPAAPATVAMTVSCRVWVTPLVVRVLLAHRRLAVVVSSAITMQPSEVDRVRARSAIS